MAHQSLLPSKSHRFSQSQTWFKQKGAALIFMAFILGLGAAVYVLKTYNADAARARQDEKTYQALKDAKVALIAWAVNHPNTPGLMPYPDRNGDGNYDDTSDCYASNVNFAPNFTIGRLPLFNSDPNCVNAKNTVSSGLAVDLRDGTGERLWYEVSKNLLHDYKSTVPSPAGTSPIINPSIINNPTNPWFVVRDRSGNVISNRVAAVIIAPGAPVGDQDRSMGIAAPNQYLDKIVMADGTPYKNYTYQDFPAITPIQEFIIGDDMRVVSKYDPTYKNQAVDPYIFNDKVVFITIDELISALERRVAMEAKILLNSYNAKNGYFPDADLLGAASNKAVPGNKKGKLPIDITDNCSCIASNSCSCSFNTISSVAFKRSTGTWSTTNFSGTCTRTTSTICTCKGSGYCKNTAGTSNFTCNAAGVCTHNVTGTYTYSPLAYADIYSTSNSTMPGCSISSGNVTCNDVGSFTIGLKEPVWFKTNLWQDYFYYEQSPTFSLQVGAKTGIGALLISTGDTIVSAPYASKSSAQTRPSVIIDDYLDSVENTNNDGVFDASDKRKSLNYNDQAFMVSP